MPEPLPKPVIVAPDCCAAVQVNVELAIVELNATLVVAPLQIVCADAEPTGNGFTVITALPV